MRLKMLGLGAACRRHFTTDYVGLRLPALSMKPLHEDQADGSDDHHSGDYQEHVIPLSAKLELALFPITVEKWRFWTSFHKEVSWAALPTSSVR